MDITKQLILSILDGYTLNLRGIHGLPHWARVLENGERLAKETGADLEVVRLFAVFHDSRRINDNIDHGHGFRGVELSKELHGKLFNLKPSQLDQLHYACAHHTDGLIEADITVQTCWDADRLDLGRVGITPKSRFLCTVLAKNDQLIEWANNRARNDLNPPILNDWLKSC